MKLLILFFIWSSSLTDVVISKIHKPVVQSVRTEKLMQAVAYAYENFDVKGVDAVLNGDKADWHRGVDLYISETSERAVQIMLADKKAKYLTAKSISVSAQDMDGYSIILITSY